MLRLEKVNAKNVWDILKLQVLENQRSFVASNNISIIRLVFRRREKWTARN